MAALSAKRIIYILLAPGLISGLGLLPLIEDTNKVNISGKGKTKLVLKEMTR
jgi:hypothetical protein